MMTIKAMTGLGLLAATWFVIWIMLLILTEFILVPWDTALVRPPLGDPQRTLNDFFETAPGQYAVAAGLVGASIWLAFRALRHDRIIAFHFAGVNLLFAAGVLIVFMVAALLNNAIFPYPPVIYDPNYPGYYRSVVPGLAVGIVCVLWLLTQVRLAKSATA